MSQVRQCRQGPGNSRHVERRPSSSPGEQRVAGQAPHQRCGFVLCEFPDVQRRVFEQFRVDSAQANHDHGTEDRVLLQTTDEVNSARLRLPLDPYFRSIPQRQESLAVSVDLLCPGHTKHDAARVALVRQLGMRDLEDHGIAEFPRRGDRLLRPLHFPPLDDRNACVRENQFASAFAEGMHVFSPLCPRPPAQISWEDRAMLRQRPRSLQVLIHPRFAPLPLLMALPHVGPGVVTPRRGLDARMRRTCKGRLHLVS